MALYAYDGDFLVFAPEAAERREYRCSQCRSVVKVRKGRFRVPHYYHLSKSPTCRLYSKSEDHMLAQLAIQSLLPAGETTIEKPFFEIARVADLIWEKPKIAFEIQCSVISLHEIKQRILDYANMGYQVVWILDDRIFNRRACSTAEQLIRLTPSYYATLRKQTFPIFYDQFEIIQENKRVKRGRKLKVQLQRAYPVPIQKWAENHFPKQILQKITTNPIFFHGDLIHKALLAKSVPALAFTMHTLRVLEEFYKRKAIREKNLFLRFLTKWMFEPFGMFILKLHEKMEF